MYADPTGELGLLFGFVAATVVAGIANAISTAVSGGSVGDIIVSGLIGAGSTAVGFGIAMLSGFSPWGNLAARAVASTLSDLGTTLYRTGRITGQDIACTIVDVTLDVCFSAITYYYTDPIKDFGKQTLINSAIDGGVDVFETYVFNSGLSNQPPAISMPSAGGGYERCYAKLGMKGNCYVMYAY